eukprot:1161262-Pelagomonas_calceolata.AAC.16
MACSKRHCKCSYLHERFTARQQQYTQQAAEADVEQPFSRMLGLRIIGCNHKEENCIGNVNTPHMDYGKEDTKG